MSTAAKEGTTIIQQSEVVIPDIPMKGLLAAIPAHCFQRSTLRSSLSLTRDLVAIAAIYKAAAFLDAFFTPQANDVELSYPVLVYSLARFSVWSLYGFLVSLFAVALWGIAHECGHQAFSESQFINDSVGWVLHSSLGVPYHSWKIVHAKHHASTGHMTEDQLFIPPTRSELGLPPFDAMQETLLGWGVSANVKNQLWDALGDTPIQNALKVAIALLVGFPVYLFRNTTGPKRYPPGTSHFNPSAVLFKPHQYGQVIVSDIGVLLWLAGIVGSIYRFGFWSVLRVYLLPYLWVNHWVVMITFLQHTDPVIPHYRAPEFTFIRGALSTLNRSFMGDCGEFMAWVGAITTHGICETHVVHHVHSRIPHYNAWEASDAIRRYLKERDIVLDGAPVGWREIYRVFRECKFVEDEGNVVFYKNAHGLAASRPKIIDETPSDSDVEV